MWEAWLATDVDKVYLLDLVLNGLWISENGYQVTPFFLQNYSSVRDNICELHKNLEPELAAGRVVKVPRTAYSNAVGLIPKANTTEMRRITDLSRPHGASVNDSVPDRHFKFQTLEVALRMMTPQCFMTVIDIRHAYRHVVIRPQDWDLQSFTIGGQCYQDRCMSLG